MKPFGFSVGTKLARTGMLSSTLLLCHALAFPRAGAATITNDVFAKDTSGNPIYAQGGGVFKFNGVYYWYGVKYNGAVSYYNNPWSGQNNNTSFAGISCYSSTNLVDWKFERLSTTGLSGYWVGRMGVCYNPNTKQYVLIAQRNGGIMFATSSTPNGTFVFRHTQEPADLSFIHNNGTGDQTIFIDDDGTPYVIASSVRGRSHLYVLPLRASDYLWVEPGTEIYSGNGREGNCMFKYNGKYYFCSSDLYGWNSSRCYVLESVGTNIMGPYLPEYVMDRSALDYCHVTQTGFFYTVKGTNGTTVLFVGDRWSDFAGNGIGYNQWCPLTFNGTKPTFQSVSVFDLDDDAGTWSVAPGNNYILNPAYEADRIAIANVVGWTSTGSGFGNASGSGHVPGDFHYRHFSTNAYSATTRQLVTGLPAGIYKLSVWHKSSGGQSTARIFARNYGGPEKLANINTPQSAWTQMTITNIAVTNGQCEVGFSSVASANQSVDVDDWSLTLEEKITLPPGQQIRLWRFNETNGATASESIANQHGTLTGGANWTTGKFGNAVTLNGSSGYVSFPNGVVSSLHDFTIAGWINLNSVGSWSRIFDFGSGTAANMFLTPRAGGAGGAIRYAIKTSNGSEQQINGTTIPSTGAWHHCAVTLSGTIGILYVDGVEVGRNTSMTLTPSNLGMTSQNWIGRSQYASDPFLNGRVDDLRIYNYGLSSSDVAALANATPAEPQPPWISRVDLLEDRLIFGGTNGALDAIYQVLASTNLMLPMSNWIAIATNYIPAGSPFAFTNERPPSPETFFRLQVQ